MKTVITVMVLAMLAELALVAGIIFVAVHFIQKIW